MLLYISLFVVFVSLNPHQYYVVVVGVFERSEELSLRTMLVILTNSMATLIL